MSEMQARAQMTAYTSTLAAKRVLLDELAARRGSTNTHQLVEDRVGFVISFTLTAAESARRLSSVVSQADRALFRRAPCSAAS